MRKNLKGKAALCIGTLAVLCAWPMMRTDAKATDGIEINKKNFPDTIFRRYVIDFCDLNKNMRLESHEIKAVTKMKLVTIEDDGDLMYEYAGVRNLTGIENFTNLREFYCAPNMKKLNLSGNKKLVRVGISDMYNTIGTEKYRLEQLDVSKNKKLEDLVCEGANLKAIRLPKGNKLKSLGLMGNNLKSLDVSACKGLKTLNCSGNRLTSLNLSHNRSLKNLDCQFNNLKALDLSKNKALKKCQADESTKLTGAKYNIRVIPEILEIKPLKNKKVRVIIKKIKGAEGYEILCSDNRKFKGAEVINSKKNKAVLENIEPNKDHHLKVRAYYKNAKGKKVYSGYGFRGFRYHISEN